MSQAYDPILIDVRNFGEQIQRLIDEDLNRPDLLNIAPKHLQDAVRYYSNDPFFFNEFQNSIVRTWAANLYVTRGYTIRDTIAAPPPPGPSYIFVALTDGLVGAVKPNFTPTLFTPANIAGVVFTPGQPGTTVDNQVTWATVIAWPASNAPANTFWTELSTIPATNVYTPPIDYIAPQVIEVTAANLRIPLTKIPYPELRAMDVIRPAPITVWPSFWAFYQSQFYFWPYPNAFYPITLSYYTAPFPPRQAADSNFWTTDAEKLIRKRAAHTIQKDVLKDPEAAALAADDEIQERISLQQRYLAQQGRSGVPPEHW